MEDPVLGADGHTYEKAAITEWLRVHATSPMTREPMNVQGLRPNHSLKSMIQRFKAAPAITVVPVQPKQQKKQTKQQSQTKQSQQSQQSQASLIEHDHYYAISVFQEEALRQKPAVPLPVSQPQSQSQSQPVRPLDLSHNRKVMAIFCSMFIFIIVMIFIIRQFE
jgi:hypothetical protein